MEFRRRRQRLLGAALVLALLASLTLSSASGLAMTDQEVLVNGSFEEGFSAHPGCGMVGKGWGCFTNGGTVVYGFYDDQWKPVVADGDHSQLIELNTMQFAASESDRYAGIYQTAHVVKGATYTLQIKGLMREADPDPMQDKYRYRVQWGYTADSRADWTKVTNWQELPWDKIDERTAPTGLESFSTTFKAPGPKITLFIRVWKKWGTAYKELDVNLDAISLVGKAVTKPVVVIDTPHKDHKDHGKPDDTTVVPACGGTNLVSNGDFESGFADGVGVGWSAFVNGGRAAYGFYDEMWPPVIQDGKHGQLIEINTWGLAASDPDRYAGIYQVVKGLKKGASYELSLYGMMREEASHPDEDKYRYRVQWGWAPADADPSADDITNWTEISWDAIYERKAPGTMAAYSARLVAPAKDVVLAIRAWKKWGTAYRELDVNLDAIKLVPCGGPKVCYHVVESGQSLSKIARLYRTTVAELMKLNGLKNANVLLVGQKLRVPCREGKPPVVVTPEPPPDGECIWYTVQRGDSLYKLAQKYNTTVAAIAERNKIANPSLIYVGQKLCIVDP